MRKLAKWWIACSDGNMNESYLCTQKKSTQPYNFAFIAKLTRIHAGSCMGSFGSKKMPGVKPVLVPINSTHGMIDDFHITIPDNSCV